MPDEQEGTLPMWGSNKDGTLIRPSVGKKSLQEIRKQTEDKESPHTNNYCSDDESSTKKK
eukprot:gene21202-15691_t